MNSLYIAATGMKNQQLNVDMISNNLANINTTGFKKSDINFKDLAYKDIIVAKERYSAIGLGSGVDGVRKIFTQGNIKETGNPLDLAIEGEGYFTVRLADGTLAYTRDGSFRIDSDGRFVNSAGNILVPPITLAGFYHEMIISEKGVISVLEADSEEMREVGKITLVRFKNPGGLEAISGNLFKETIASGPPVNDNGDGSFGNIRQGYLEMSNINVIEEMVNLISAQRAYEINSKAIKSSDEMMGMANALRQ
jgi:flagellar basal-body rod protein FlgG